MSKAIQGVQTVLVVTARPDDVDFGASGTVATWTAEGIDVHSCVCTSGEAGGTDAQTRQAEQRAAAALLGVRSVRFLEHPDGAVVPSIELRRDIARVIR